MRTWTAWTTAEHDTLRRLYPATPWEKLYEAIPRHPRVSICRKASELGLHRPRTPRRARYKFLRKLWDIRMDRKLDRRQLAGKVGCHFLTLAKWERGETVPSMAALMAWCEALNCQVVIWDGLRRA